MRRIASRRRLPYPNSPARTGRFSSIDGRDTLGGPELTADLRRGCRVNGDSGCNRFSGPYVQTGHTVNFGEVLSTRRACAETDRQRQEDRLLAVLRGATTAQLVRG